MRPGITGLLLLMACTDSAVIERRIPDESVGSSPPIIIEGDATELDSAVCGTCRITLTAGALLGAIDDPVSIGRSSTATQDWMGRFLVAPVATPGAIAVYSAEGGFLTAHNLEGAGPGEFRRIQSLAVGPGDSLWVLGSQKMGLLTPSYEGVREALLGGISGHWFALLEDRRVALNNYRMLRPAIALLSHEFDTVRSFGPRLAQGVRDSDGLLLHLTSDTAGRIVGVPVNYRYEILIFDTLGNTVDRLARRPSWFPEWSRGDRRPLNASYAKPQPQVTEIHMDDNDRLWVLIKVASVGWTSKGRPATPEEAQSFLGVNERAQYVDTILEVFDLTDRRLIVSERFETPLRGFADSRRLYGFEETEKVSFRSACGTRCCSRTPLGCDDARR